MSSIAAIGMTAHDVAKDMHASGAAPGIAGPEAHGSRSNPSTALQESFSSLVDAAHPNATPAAFRATLPRAILRDGNGLGDQVLGGLEKLGRSMEAFNAMGSTPTPAMMTVPTDPKNATHGSGKADPLSSLQEMWQGGLQQQRQLYATVFEFELVEESSESMMKSLKSLLTQGGG